MKNLRCLLALLLILSGLLAIPIQAASAPTDVKANIDYLSRSGIPEEYLESLTAEDIAEMYERCFGKEIIFNTHPAKYCTEIGTSDGGNMRISVSEITELSREAGTNRAIIERVTVYVDYEWLSMPFFKKTDRITLGWDGDRFVPADNSFRFVDYQKDIDNELYVGTVLNNPADFQSGGLEFSFSLAPYYILGENCEGYKGRAQIVLLPKEYPAYYDSSADTSVQTASAAKYVHQAAMFENQTILFDSRTALILLLFSAAIAVPAYLLRRIRKIS